MKRQKSLVCVLSALWVVLFVVFTLAFPIVICQSTRERFLIVQEDLVGSTVLLSPQLPGNLTGMIVYVQLSSQPVLFNNAVSGWQTYEYVVAVQRVLWDDGEYVQTEGDHLAYSRVDVKYVVIYQSLSYTLKYVYAVCLSGLLFVDLIVVFSLLEKWLNAFGDYVNRALKYCGM